MNRIILAARLAGALSGCAQSIYFRSTPAGALVTVNSQPVGTTPVAFRTEDINPLSYRVAKVGFAPVEGRIETVKAKGRIVAAVFTLGILAMRPLHVFAPDEVDVNFVDIAAKTEGILRLYNVKAATILEGQCQQRQARVAGSPFHRASIAKETMSRSIKKPPPWWAAPPTITGSSVGIIGRSLPSVASARRAGTSRVAKKSRT